LFIQDISSTSTCRPLFGDGLHLFGDNLHLFALTWRALTLLSKAPGPSK
jgi:hypothetical protein